MEDGGKRVSWVELYLDLVFVLAVGQLARLIVGEPEMRSVWIALGLFFTLWWTWVGFAVLYNRTGADEPAQRLLFLVASAAAWPGCCRCGSRGRACLGRPLRAVDLDPGAVSLVLWRSRSAPSSAPCWPRIATSGAGCAAITICRAGSGGPRPRRWLAPLRRAVRPVPDHPAGGGRGGGGPGLGRRPRGHGGRLGRARGGDDPGRHALVGVLRLGGRDQRQGPAALGGSPTMARAIFAVGHMLPLVLAADHHRGVGLLLEELRRQPRLWLAYMGIGIYLLGTRVFLAASRHVSGLARVLLLIATFQLARLEGELSPHAYCGCSPLGVMCAALTARSTTRNSSATWTARSAGVPRARSPGPSRRRRCRSWTRRSG